MKSYQFRLTSETASNLEMEIAFRDDAAAMRYAETFPGYQVEVAREALCVGQVSNRPPQAGRTWWFRASPPPSWLPGSAAR